MLVLLILVVVFGVRWTAELSRRSTRGVEGPGPDPWRLERIESALASLERRLDEMQDQQRFLERLLAERSDPRALPPGGAAPGRTGESEGGGEGVDSILFDTDRGEG